MFFIRSVAFTALTLLAANASIADVPTTYGNCKLDGEIHLTNVSGIESSDTDEISFDERDYYGLRTIKNYEHNNEPCRTAVLFGRMPYKSGVLEEIGATSSTCTGSAVGDKIEVGATEFAPEGVFVGAIRAWTNNKSDESKRRLKGLAANARMITEDCEVVPVEPSDIEPSYESSGDGFTVITWSDEAKRANANIDYDTRYCLRGQVAMGLILHRGDRGIGGVQLMCRDVVPE